MSVSVVIPATRRSVAELIATLRAGSLVPDEILVVSNEVTGVGAETVRFASDEHPIGTGDAALRRDIGADLATGEILLFLDDDLRAPGNLVERAAEIALREGWCWGHHRYRDFRVPFDNDDPPENGRSREYWVNDWHGYQSSYAGLLAIRRDLFWEVGGFDLGYLGHHGSEDQQLGLRLSRRGPRPGMSFVWEPPFAWHPETPLYHSSPMTNISGSHSVVVIKHGGVQFLACGEVCPYRAPLEIDQMTVSESIAIPYRRTDVRVWKE